MKDEKILQDELMSDEELENIFGGYTGDADYVKLLKDFGDFLESVE